MTKNIYRSIRPGEIWLDTAGKPIHAHMPRLFYEDGVYYWYGFFVLSSCRIRSVREGDIRKINLSVFSV